MFRLFATAAIFAVLLAGGAWAQEPRSGAFLQCRGVADPTQRLACYDKAATAFDQAQARGEVVVVDREKVRAVRRQAFGFRLPTLDLLPKAAGEAPLRNMNFRLSSANHTIDDKWMMQTDDETQWVQTDATELSEPPRAGSQLTVRAGALGSFFCKVDGQPAFRCQRRR